MNNRVSHLNVQVHENLCQALELTKNLQGEYVEVGVYLGGSALTAIHYIEEAIKNGFPKREIWLLDTFDGFHYEEALKSPDALWANTHKLLGTEKTIQYISATLGFSILNVHLIKANICTNDLPAQIQKIAVANIDVDMYEPTLAALNKVSNLIVPGGIIICEDPASTPALYGSLLAMETFLATDRGNEYTKIYLGSQYFLIKKL